MKLLGEGTTLTEVKPQLLTWKIWRAFLQPDGRVHLYKGTFREQIFETPRQVEEKWELEKYARALKDSRAEAQAKEKAKRIINGT